MNDHDESDKSDRLVQLMDKWRDDAAWLERLSGRLEPYNAYTADAIRACRAEVLEIFKLSNDDERRPRNETRPLRTPD